MHSYVIFYPGSRRISEAGLYFAEALRFACAEAGILKSDVVLAKHYPETPHISAFPIYRVSPNNVVRSLSPSTL